MKKFLFLPALALAFMLGGVLTAKAAVVYDALPDPLPGNVASLGYEATSTSEFGDYVQLVGTERHLTTVTVTMSNWALKDTPANVTFCSSNSTCTPNGFYHPITVNIYSNSLALLVTKTENIFVPWRPPEDQISCPTQETPGYAYKWQSTSGDPDTNCYNGYAFNAVFDLSSSNTVLPNDVIVGVEYNTQSYGSQLGVDGPYNSLNVGVPEGQIARMGSDENTDNVFWNTSYAPFYTDGGVAGVGTFREDTNWSPYGTVAMQIEAIATTPTTVDQCKKGGWASFILPRFKNQGDCVSYLQSSEKAVGNRRDNPVVTPE